jgi:hypothetical protein
MQFPNPKFKNKKRRRRRKKITNDNYFPTENNMNTYQQPKTSFPEPNRNPNLNSEYSDRSTPKVKPQVHNVRTQAAICYYSNHCKYSKELLEEINRFNIKENKIQLYCIDNNRNNLPSILKSVPTIIDGSTPYIGESAFDFLTKIVKGESINVMAVNSGVASSFSDTFVSLEGDDGFSQNTDLNSSNFSSIDYNEFSINTIKQKENNIVNTTGNDLMRKMEEMKQMRAQDFKHPPPRT